MVQLYAISIYRTDAKPATKLVGVQDVSSFGYFQRNTASQFMNFFSQTIAERTAPGTRSDVEENNYVGHIYARTDKIVGVILSDKDYPKRVAHTLLVKILDDFVSKYPPVRITTTTVFNFPELDAYLSRYQDPENADTIMRVQAELDETKIILHKTIESVLERGEKLDNLVERSDALSSQSRMFFKQAKKTNSCCVVM